MTVRRALHELDSWGLVTAKQGQGTFARSFDLGNASFHLDFLNGEWPDDAADIRLLSASMRRADEKIAAKLAVAEGQMVIYLRRLVLYDGNPAMSHTEHIIYDPRRPLVESQLQLTSLHAFLESGETHRFPRGALTLSSVNLDEESAITLGECEGASALRLEHEFQDEDGTPVSWGWFLLRSDLFSLRARLGPR